MSHASGACKFKDGTIMFCEYDGTSDFMLSKLYKTNQERRDNWRKICETPNCKHKIEGVELYSDYGRGFYWKAKACRKCNTIVERYQPYHSVECDYWSEDKNEDEWAAISGIPEWTKNIWQ